MIPTHLLQTGNDIDRSVYEQILQFIRLRVTETYAFPPEIVRVDDITIATLGNFSASVGKPKSKKTFNIIFGNVELLKGTPLGKLAVTLSGTPESVGDALEFIRSQNVVVEAL